MVHIVDDDAQVRAATAYLLSSHGYATETYAGGAEFLGRADLGQGCLLLDLRMPGMDGHQVQEELARRGAPIPAVVMSGHGELGAAVEAMKLGAVDFLAKPPSEEELLSAVRRAQALFSEGQEKRNAEQEAALRLERLSPRERQMLQGLVAGLSNKEIARRLGLSPRTVEMHRANMMDALGTGTLSEALRIAIDARVPPLGEAESERSATSPAQPQAAMEAAVRSRLRGHEETLRLVLDGATDGSWEWRVPQDELLLSRHLVESIGYSQDEAPHSYRELAGLIHPADWDRFRRELADHLDHGTEPLKTEFRIRRPNGGWIWLHDCGGVVERDPVTGAPIRMVGTVSDITQRKAEERSARDAAERIELAQWGAGAGIWEIDLATETVRLCPRSRTMLGLPPEGPEEMTRQELRSLVHHEDLPGVIAAVTEAEKGGVCRMEFRSVGPDGRRRWILGLGKAAPGRDGRPERLVGLYQDVTGSKEAALELQRVQRQLIDLTQLSATGTMASTLAHELAQPLTAVSNFSRGIAQRIAATPLVEDGRLRDAIAGAEASARLAADIVARLQRSAGHAEAERQEVRLGTLVRSACSLALSDSDARGIRHSIALDPAADRVEADPVQIQQLLLNLVGNAAEAVMEVPVPRRRIRIATRRLGPDEVEIEVADSGGGIAPELRDGLFDLFASSKGEGRGIGLVLCRAIALAHGGGIRAGDAPGGGASFSVTLRA
ncbi:MAG TPA: PAS domain-containing protein [Allosphingosinicella sp.]|nr:PAS domain-containing protein [Allosphingosinicella sp.]